jgi:hypothetical protein
VDRLNGGYRVELVLVRQELSSHGCALGATTKQEASVIRPARKSAVRNHRLEQSAEGRG